MAYPRVLIGSAVLLLLLPQHQQLAAARRGANGDRASEFEVRFTTNAPIGLKLGTDLLVIGFHREHGNRLMPAEASGWIRTGDALVAVNGHSVDGKSIGDVASEISSVRGPKILRFAAVGGGDRVSEMAKQQHDSNVSLEPPPVHDDAGGGGRLVLTHAGLPWGELDYQRALFGGRPTCRTAPIVWVEPVTGCGAYAPAMRASASGAWVVVRRGGCSFSDKSILAQDANAVGLIVVNDDASGEIIRMPADPTAAKNVYLPALMISAPDGARILAADSHINRGESARDDAAAASKHTGRLHWEARAVGAGVTCPKTPLATPSQPNKTTTGGDEGQAAAAAAAHAEFWQPHATGGWVVIVSSPSTSTGDLTSSSSSSSSSSNPAELSDSIPASSSSHMAAVHARVSPEQTWEAALARSVERMEFLRASFGSPLPVPGAASNTSTHQHCAACQGMRLHLAFPPDGCDAAAAALTGPSMSHTAERRDMVLVVDRGGCSFEEKAAVAAAAYGAAVLLIVNDRPGIAPMEASPHSTRKTDTGAAVPTVPAIVMIPQSAGARLRHAIQNAVPTASPPPPQHAPESGSSSDSSAAAAAARRGEPAAPSVTTTAAAAAPSGCACPGGPRALFRGSDGIADLWGELAYLSDPARWPEDASQRKKAYMRYARGHHPDRLGGSQDRFEELVVAYKRAEAARAPPPSSSGWAHRDGEL